MNARHLATRLTAQGFTLVAADDPNISWTCPEHLKGSPIYRRAYLALAVADGRIVPVHFHEEFQGVYLQSNRETGKALVIENDGTIYEYEEVMGRLLGGHADKAVILLQDAAPFIAMILSKDSFVIAISPTMIGKLMDFSETMLGDNARLLNLLKDQNPLTIENRSTNSSVTTWGGKKVVIRTGIPVMETEMKMDATQSIEWLILAASNGVRIFYRIAS